MTKLLQTDSVGSIGHTETTKGIFTYLSMYNDKYCDIFLRYILTVSMLSTVSTNTAFLSLSALVIPCLNFALHSPSQIVATVVETIHKYHTPNKL